MTGKPLIVAALVVLGAGAVTAGWLTLHPRDRLAQGTALAGQGDIRGALIALRGAVQDHPELAEPHFRLALLDLRVGDAIAAEKELTAAGARGWPAQSIALPMAQALLVQRRYADALRSVSTDAIPPDAKTAALILRAQAELGLQHLDAAQAAVGDAERGDPHSGDAVLTASRVARARGDPVLATAKAVQAATLMPHPFDALVEQAELYLERGDRVRALAALDAAVTDTAAGQDRLLYTRLRRASLLVDMGEPRASAEIDAVLAQQPNLPFALYLRAVQFAREKNWTAALAALNQIGAALDTIPRSNYLLAIVKDNAGQPEQALDAAERAVARAPSDLLAVRLLAGMHLSKHRPDQAVRVLARAVDAGNADVATLSMLTQAYTDAGQPQKAQAALETAARLAPSDRQVANQLAGLQLRAGDARSASLTLQRTLDAIPVALPDGAAAPLPGPPAAQTATAMVLAALQAGDVDRAAEGVAKLRQLHADDGQVALLDGMVKMARADRPGARTAFETALRLAPDSVPARFGLARLYMQQNDPAHAAQLLQQVFDADKGNLQALFGLTDIDMAAGQRQRAVERLENAHQASPANLLITLALGDLYVRTGTAAKTLPLLDTAQAGIVTAQAEPGMPQAAAMDGLLAARVRAQSALGERHEAIETGSKLLARRPDNVTVRLQLVELLAAEKDWDGAAKLIAAGLAAQPGQAALLTRDVSLAAQAGGPDAGLARADQLAADPANAAAARTLKGDLLLSERRYTEAAAAYAAQSGPGAPLDLVLHQSNALTNSGNAAKAVTILQDWLVGHPDSSEVLITLGSLEITFGRLADARRHLERGLAVQPGNTVALNNYAWLLQQAGELELARQTANRAWLLSPSSETADTLGWIDLARGDKEAALLLLRPAAAALKDNPTVQYHLASALKQNGQTAEARRILAGLVSLPTAFAEKAAASDMLKTLAP